MHAQTSSHRLRPRPALLAAGAAITTALLPLGAVPLATAPVAAAAPRHDPVAATAVSYALAQLGKPYRWGSEGPKAFDCSGLTSAAYAAARIDLPRTSRDQYRRLPTVARRDARPGDLLFWGSKTSKPSTIYHVEIYLGHGMAVSAPRTGTVVQIVPVRKAGLMPRAARPAGVHAAKILPVARGARGDEVKAVQRRLRANGYRVDVDGSYGRTTDTAVRSLQRKAGLRPGDVVGKRTWGALVAHGTRSRTAP